MVCGDTTGRPQPAAQVVHRPSWGRGQLGYAEGTGSHRTGQGGQQMRGQKDSAQDTSIGGLKAGRLEEAGPTTLSCP